MSIQINKKTCPKCGHSYSLHPEYEKKAVGFQTLKRIVGWTDCGCPKCFTEMRYKNLLKVIGKTRLTH